MERAILISFRFTDSLCLASIKMSDNEPQNRWYLSAAKHLSNIDERENFICKNLLNWPKVIMAGHRMRNKLTKLVTDWEKSLSNITVFRRLQKWYLLTIIIKIYLFLSFIYLICFRNLICSSFAEYVQEVQKHEKCYFCKGL